MAADSIRSFREKLDGFVFFHLGSDAVVSLDGAGDGATVRIEHARVHSFEVRLDGALLDKLSRDSSAFEDFMLDLLTQHRRSRMA